jgi:hypothetical protein
MTDSGTHRKTRQGPAVAVRPVILCVELTPGEAAGLKRLADKTGWSEAMAVLYPHIGEDIRGDQAREILRALARIHEALQTVKVSSFPWISCGHAESD